MRIRALQPVKAYWNYQVHELAEGDVVKGGLAEHLAADPRVEVLDGVPFSPGGAVSPPSPFPIGDSGPEAVIPVTTSPPELPDGTVPEVLDWVGDDRERAAQARTAEAAKSSPRTTLLAKLDEILDTE